MTLSQISEGILTYLEDAGVETRQIDFKEITDRAVGSLQRPAVNISINSGSWSKITLTAKKVNCKIDLLLLVQNLKGEKERRNDVYNLMEAIGDALFIVSLDLELQDLVQPRAFTNVTDARFNDAGYILYTMEFSCSFVQEKTEEDLGILRSIVNNYIADDEIIGDEETVTVGAYYGGSAWVGNQLPDLDGGRANTVYWTEEIWGGYSSSTFTT